MKNYTAKFTARYKKGSLVIEQGSIAPVFKEDVQNGIIDPETITDSEGNPVNLKAEVDPETGKITKPLSRVVIEFAKELPSRYEEIEKEEKKKAKSKAKVKAKAKAKPEKEGESSE